MFSVLPFKNLGKHVLLTCVSQMRHWRLHGYLTIRSFTNDQEFCVWGHPLSFFFLIHFWSSSHCSFACPLPAALHFPMETTSWYILLTPKALWVTPVMTHRVAIVTTLWVATERTLYVTTVRTLWVAAIRTLWMAAVTNLWVATERTLWVAALRTLWVATEKTLWVATERTLYWSDHCNNSLSGHFKDSLSGRWEDSLSSH